MRRLRHWIVPLLACTAWLLTAQEALDREKYARDYIQFQVDQLNQWNKEFPQQFFLAMMKPPVDAGSLSEAAKAGAGEFADSMQKLAKLSLAANLTKNQEFRAHLEKTIAASRDLNTAMSAQRFPRVLFNDWDQIRSTLNNLARVYQLDPLAVLDPLGTGGGRGSGRGAAGAATTPAAGPVPGGLSGYIVDVQCSKRGKGMWINAECVARCIRDGDKIVLVTEDGKIYQIVNQEKITPEVYGQVVTLLGKAEGETITVESVKQ